MEEKKNIKIKKDDTLVKALMTQEMLKKIEQQAKENNSNVVKIIEQFSIDKSSKK